MNLFYRSALALFAVAFAMPAYASPQSGSQFVCREYQETIRIGSEEQVGYGMACKRPDGSWEKVTGPSVDTSRPVPSAQTSRPAPPPQRVAAPVRSQPVVQTQVVRVEVPAQPRRAPTQWYQNPHNSGLNHPFLNQQQFQQEQLLRQGLLNPGLVNQVLLPNSPVFINFPRNNQRSFHRSRVTMRDIIR